MARAIWTGTISFGLVSIPVGLYSAVSEKTIRFHQLQQGTSDRIRYKRVNESTGEEVAYQEIVKGYETGSGQYVVVTPTELEAVEPAGGKTIEIEDFVDQVDIDPIFYDQTYYVGPRNEAAARPYALLVQAMRSSGKVAIARFVMRSKEHLAAIRVADEVLALETMYFADEIRDPMREVEFPPTGEPPRERELTTAVSLIESMACKWDATNYHDRYRERVEELIERKLEGEEVVTSHRPERDTNVVDLMDALKRSVDRARESRGSTGASASEPAPKPTRARGAKKAAAHEPEEQSAPAGERKRQARRQPQGEQLSMMSKEELYQLAQDIKVPGRSKMTRDELEQAVATAQARRAS